MAALAGANLIFGSGMVESGMTFDYGQLVMDNEFAGMIKHCVGGIPVSDESLAVDVIHEVGPSTDFLGHEHTYKHMKLQSRPDLIDRRVLEDWEASGGTDIYERAWEKATTILETHKPEPVPDGVVATIREIVESADRSVKVS